METPNLIIMRTFGLDNLPDLHTAVLGALELFMTTPDAVPSLSLGDYQLPFFAGSGNGKATAGILAQGAGAVVGDENKYEALLDKYHLIDGAVLISASGGKHAPKIAEFMMERGLETRLLTCNQDAPARKYVPDELVFVFPKNREPATYNTSTYMGMILAKTHESPRSIHGFINDVIEPATNVQFREFGAFCLIVPDQFDIAAAMYNTKFVELFGRRIARDVFTSEEIKHMKTVVKRDDELFIGIGYDNQTWGEHRLNMPIPDDADYAAMMAIGYYLIGKIQSQFSPWFKESIVEACKEQSRIFGYEIPVIVE